MDCGQGKYCAPRFVKDDRGRSSKSWESSAGTFTQGEIESQAYADFTHEICDSILQRLQLVITIHPALAILMLERFLRLSMPKSLRPGACFRRTWVHDR